MLSHCHVFQFAVFPLQLSNRSFHSSKLTVLYIAMDCLSVRCFPSSALKQIVPLQQTNCSLYRHGLSFSSLFSLFSSQIDRFTLENILFFTSPCIVVQFAVFPLQLSNRSFHSRKQPVLYIAMYCRSVRCFPSSALKQIVQLQQTYCSLHRHVLSFSSLFSLFSSQIDRSTLANLRFFTSPCIIFQFAVFPLQLSTRSFHSSKLTVLYIAMYCRSVRCFPSSALKQIVPLQQTYCSLHRGGF